MKYIFFLLLLFVFEAKAQVEDSYFDKNISEQAEEEEEEYNRANLPYSSVDVMPCYNGGWGQFVKDFESAIPSLSLYTFGNKKDNLIDVYFTVDSCCNISNVQVGIDNADIIPDSFIEIENMIINYLKTVKISSAGLNKAKYVNVQMFFCFKQRNRCVIENIKELQVNAIDLGLSSGTLWADVNLTDKESAECYYSWGENHTFNCSYDVDKKVIHDIAGKREYDAATMTLGDEWSTPNCMQFQELIDECKWKWCNRNGIYGYLIRGRNGNSIFLPCASCLPSCFPKYTGLYLCSDNISTAKCIQNDELACTTFYIGLEEKNKSVKFFMRNPVYGIGFSIRAVKWAQPTKM